MGLAHLTTNFQELCFTCDGMCCCFRHMPMCTTGDEMCIDDADIGIDGKFMTCSDCRKYMVINQGKATTMSCRAGFGFNADIRSCEKRSPHCFECSCRRLIVDLQCWSRTTPAIITHIKIYQTNHLNLVSVYVT